MLSFTPLSRYPLSAVDLGDYPVVTSNGYYRRLLALLTDGNMIIRISEGTAARRRVYLYLVDATDGLTPETTEAGGQPQISKNGGAWANTTATLTAVGNGTYYVELTVTEVNTAGTVSVRYKSANTAEFSTTLNVVGYDPHDGVRLGITALPNANAEAAGGLYTRGTGAGQIDQDANGRILANTTAWGGTAVTGLVGIMQSLGVIRRQSTAGGGPSSITLDAGANGNADYYVGLTVVILTGTGAGQARVITAYDGGTQVATVDRPWIVEPTNDGLYELRVGMDSAGTVADAVWDEPRSGHVASGSFGENLQDSSTRIVTRFTALSGTAAYVQHPGSPPATNGYYDGMQLTIVSGTGAGQSRKIASYVSTGFSYFDHPLATAADATSVCVIHASTTDFARTGTVFIGATVSATSTTVVLPNTASATNDTYLGMVVSVAGQSRIITDYVGASRTATVHRAWITNPVADQIVSIRAVGPAEVAAWATSAGTSLTVPNNLVSGRVDASAGALAANVITSTAINAGAITAGKFATDAIDSTVLAASAVTEIQSGLATAAALTVVDDFLDTEISTLLSDVAAIKAITDLLTLPAIADAVLDEVVEGAFTLRQYARGYASALFGKASFTGTDRNFRDRADTKNRIASTVDATGRTVVTLDLT